MAFTSIESAARGVVCVRVVKYILHASSRAAYRHVSHLSTNDHSIEKNAYGKSASLYYQKEIENTFYARL